MSKVLRPSKITTLVLLVLAALIGTTTRSFAQTWTQNVVAPFVISDVTFLDAQSAPLRGFIGGDLSGGVTGGISITTDGGATWNACSCDIFTGFITDFAFRDSVVGYASIRGNGTGSGFTFSGILKTIDTGHTWKLLANAPHEVNGLYFNKVTGTLFAATQAEGGVQSTDGGQTWTVFEKDSATIWTGFAISGNSGVMTTGMCPINFSGNLPYWDRTLDGGKTWHRLPDPQGSHMYLSTWQALAIPGTNTIYATSDCDGALYRSDDNGYNFATVNGPVNNGNTNVATGVMGGDGCSMFIPYNANQTGVAYSTNDGIVWMQLGQISPPMRARFYVGPNKIWEYQGKALSYAPRPSNPIIHIISGTHIDFSKAKCQDNDTILRMVSCIACGSNPRITGDTIGWPPNSTQRNFSIVGLGAHNLCGPDSSVTIRYHPTSAIPDTAYIHLQFTNANGLVDTTIMVTGPGVKPSLYVQNKHAVIYRKACDPFDTALIIGNHSCSNLTVKINPATGATNQIQNTDGVAPFSFSLPQGVDQPLNFHMVWNATGTYDLYEDITVSAPGAPDTIIHMWVTLIVTTTATPDYRSITKTFNDPCSIRDSFIVFGNSLCDTVTLERPNITNLGMDIDSSGPPPIHFPVKLAPGSIVRLLVHLRDQKKNSYPGTVTWQYYVGHDSLNPSQNKLDLSYKILNDINLTGTATPTSFSFGNVPNCQCKTQKITIINRACLPITVASIAPKNFPANGAFTILSGGLHVGETIPPNGFDTMVVQYCATMDTDWTSSRPSGSVIVKYYNGVDTGTGTYLVSGAPIAQVQTTMQISTIDFGTFHMGCDSAIWKVDSIVNSPCSPAHVYGITGEGQGWTVVSPALHTLIPAGGSIPVLLRFAPTSATPALPSTSIIIETRDVSENQQGSMNQVDIHAVVVPAVRSYTLSQIASRSVKNCETFDTTITIQNNGTCSDMSISGIDFSDTHASLGAPAPTFPVTVPTGGSLSFKVHVDPAGMAAPGPLTGTITVHAGPDTTLAYSLPIVSCSAPFVTLMAKDSVYKSANCTPLGMDYTVTASDATTVTSTLAGGGTAFTQTLKVNGTALPGNTANLSKGDVLTVTVVFQDANKTDNATLTISSTTIPYSRSIPLSGTASGAPGSARVCVRIQGGATSASMKPNDVQTLELVLLDPVASTTGVTTLKVPLVFNDNVLTPSAMQSAGAVWTPGAAVNSSIHGPNATYIYNFTKAANSGSAAGDVIGTLKMTASLAAEVMSTISVSNPKFDSASEVCQIAAVSGACTITDNLILNCSDSIIVINFNNQLDSLSKTFMIIPNPVSKGGSTANVHFTTHFEGDVTVDVLDLNGNSVSTLTSANPAHGEYTLPIPTEHLAEGTYFARVRVGRMIAVKKFVVQKN